MASLSLFLILNIYQHPSQSISRDQISKAINIFFTYRFSACIFTFYCLHLVQSLKTWLIKVALLKFLFNFLNITINFFFYFFLLIRPVSSRSVCQFLCLQNIFFYLYSHLRYIKSIWIRFDETGKSLKV